MKKSLLLLVSLLVLSVAAQVAHADAVTDNALHFLQSKQDSDGRITTGFSAPSQWSAIAFAIHGIDVATVKNPDTSLLDFLLTDVPVNNAATDWETRILTIAAIGHNPYNFGGTNYVSTLESLESNGQIGDECSLNDDIFGILALVASGSTTSAQLKQDSLNFLITSQDSIDGGFSFSAPGCAFYMTSADMTGAGLQALVAAKDHGITHPDLDSAIDKAKAYLLANQNSDGGFGYFGTSDTDTTGWVLQAFNVLGMQDDPVVQAARTYLISQQSATDGGITAFDWGTGTFVSNASTTAQALIALSGKGWLVKIFDPAAASSSAAVTPTVTVTNTPTVTPTPTSVSSNDTSPTNTPTPTAASTPTPTPDAAITLASILNGPLAQSEEEEEEDDVLAQITNLPERSVLGATDTTAENKGKGIVLAGIFAGLGLIFVFIYLAKPFIIRKFR